MLKIECINETMHKLHNTLYYEIKILKHIKGDSKGR